MYDPLLRALDEYVGWQEDATPLAGSPLSRGGRNSAASNGRATSADCDVGGRDSDENVSGGKSFTQDPQELGDEAELPSGAGFSSFSSAPPYAQRRKANVLVPGAGLGRLAAEVAARGYASVHANELSTTS